MGGDEIKTHIRKQPFGPIELGLSDGRSVLVRHPDQVVVCRRHVVFGSAHVRRRQGAAAPPADGDAVAKDWLLADLIHVISAEPSNGGPRRTRKRHR